MKKSYKPLAILTTLNILIGATSPFIDGGRSNQPTLSLVLSLGCAICLFSWCKRDAAERGIAPGAAPALVGLLAPIGILYYFFRYLPPRRASVATLKACGFFVLTIFLFSASLMAGQWAYEH